MLRYSKTDGLLRRSPDFVLDPWSWTWRETETPEPPDAYDISNADAVTALFRAKRCRLVPVAIIGPREPSAECIETAARMGQALGQLGIPILCGGKGGVMEAAARGALEKGGLTIGFIPDEDWQAANDYISIPLATGIGPARNVLIARAALALIAIGGQYGTISEAAFGLHFDKPVFGLCGAPAIEGVRHMNSVEDTVAEILPIVLRLPAGHMPADSP